MVKVIVLSGLPGSGKSTWAKEWVAAKPSNRVRINKDDLRAMLHGGKYTKGNEKQVLRIEESIIIDSLLAEKSVVVDNTHLTTNSKGNNRHFERIKQLVKSQHGTATAHLNINFELKTFDLSPEECIKRDLKRPNSVGQNIIWQMYWEHVAVIENPRRFRFGGEHSMPPAVVVDMDGTLASMRGRNPYQWDKVDTDYVRTHIATMVSLYKDTGAKVIIVTGRDGSAEAKTREWLDNNNIEFDELFIRPAGDNRPDFVIKREIYQTNIKPYFNVCLVIDDRPQVIREWRRLGLPVINANPTDREF